MKTDDISGLLAQIDFSPENVVNAAAAQSRLFIRAIDFRLKCMRERNAAKMAWEKIKAEGDLKVREEALQNGTKLTERFVESFLINDPTVTKYAEQYSRADEMDEYSKLIVDAFKMRRDCLRICGDMTRNEMSLGRDAEVAPLTETRKKIQNKFPGVK